MPFEPYALDVCYVVYKLRFYAYRFRTPLVGDTGSELPTCRAPQECSKDLSRTLGFENDLQGKRARDSAVRTDSVSACGCPTALDT
jgi:hypothetical protein